MSRVDVQDSRIMLQSGRLLDLARPEESDIELEDIAHGLAHTCRYAGQCSHFYSVAEHSVLVSHSVPRAHLAALFHDAAEAFVGDMPKPLKDLLPDFRCLEKRIEQVIFERFGIDWPAPSIVKIADYAVMAAEVRVLMPAGTNEWLNEWEVAPAAIKIARLEPSKAKKLFLDRFQELTGQS